MEKTTVNEEAVVEPALAKEVIAVAPVETQERLQWGKALFKAGNYEEALGEFEAVLHMAPGNIETRVWIRKTKEALAQPEAEEVTTPAAGAVKPKECFWMNLGVVAYRLCTKNYDCLNCEFDQMMQEQMAKREKAELGAILKRFSLLPGHQILCPYALTGNVSHRICTRLFNCETCEFGQNMEDALQRKLDKLAARRDDLRKKIAHPKH